MPRSNLSLEDWCYNNNCSDLLRHLVNKNDKLISFGSHKKIAWICDLGHKFSIDPCKFTNPHRCQGDVGVFKCPYCNGQKVLIGFNDLATTRPDLASEWDYSKNNLTPQQLTKGSHKDVWWICSKSHSWKARVSARDYGNEGCPYCSSVARTSMGEQYLYHYCMEAFSTFTVYNRFKYLGVEFDVFVKELNLAFEYDGSYWHREKNTDYKELLCNTNGIRFIRLIESNETKVIDNCFYFKQTGSVVNSDLSRVLINLFTYLSNYYQLKLPSIDLNRDYSAVRTSFVADSSSIVIKWIDKLRPEWDEYLNGYPIEYLANDGLNKYWRCSLGHSFQRRLDVIDLRGHNKCPCCENRYKWQFLAFPSNSINYYFVVDFDDLSVELASIDYLHNAVKQGINIRGVLFKNNSFSFDYDYLRSMSNSAFRSYVDSFSVVNFTTNQQECVDFVIYLNSLFKKYSIDKIHMLLNRYFEEMQLISKEC